MVIRGQENDAECTPTSARESSKTTTWSAIRWPFKVLAVLIAPFVVWFTVQVLWFAYQVCLTYSIIDTVPTPHPDSELVAWRALRQVISAENWYLAREKVDEDGDGIADYGTFEQLGKYLDSEIASGIYGGFRITLKTTPSNGGAPKYTATAELRNPGETKSPTFFVDETWIIRIERDGTVATATSTPVPEGGSGLSFIPRK